MPSLLPAPRSSGPSAASYAPPRRATLPRHPIRSQKLDLLSSSTPREVPKTGKSHIQISLCCSFPLLLKGVQHIDRVGEGGGDVDNPKRPGGIADTQLTDARTDRFHRLPVVRIEPSLDPIELKACVSPSRFWKTSERVQRVSKKDDRLQIGCILYSN